LVIAKATIALRLLSPDGRVLKQTEVTEKGGGLNDAAAIARAVDELRRTLPDNISTILP